MKRISTTNQNIWKYCRRRKSVSSVHTKVLKKIKNSGNHLIYKKEIIWQWKQTKTRPSKRTNFQSIQYSKMNLITIWIRHQYLNILSRSNFIKENLIIWNLMKAKIIIRLMIMISFYMSKICNLIKMGMTMNQCSQTILKFRIIYRIS